ncbi:MAG: transcriptional regulator, Fur family transcriptional regulator, ferric uptake regulator [Candidatus Saccharibacteria bacterium]|nr:transcriptional regulator, Fur family transcriptional regulator, ferric uptake regulator [Candidatus Saccharibacteria bacterium]
MPDPVDQLKIVLKQHSQSLTAARQTVFSALQNKEPQTMHEVVFACQGQVNRASIYRVISLFERLGIVQRLQIGWKYKLELSGAFHHHHHHMTCTQCSVTVQIPEDTHLEQHLRDAAASQSFVMQGHQLEIQGLCARCAAAPSMPL